MFYVLLYVTLYVRFFFGNHLYGKRELVALICLSSWCLVIIVWHFLAGNVIVSSLVLWYFLIILTYYFRDVFVASREMLYSYINVIANLFIMRNYFL